MDRSFLIPWEFVKANDYELARVTRTDDKKVYNIQSAAGHNAIKVTIVTGSKILMSTNKVQRSQHHCFIL